MSSAADAIRRKLVIIGDGACGKTSLLSVFTLGYFPTDYIPTVFENYVTDCKVDGKLVQLALWDTAGQEDYERLRPLAYNKAHVILIGYAVDNRDSFENVRNKWVDEAKERSPNVPIILVGLKTDLRPPEDQRQPQQLPEAGVGGPGTDSNLAQTNDRRSFEANLHPGLDGSVPTTTWSRRNFVRYIEGRDRAEALNLRDFKECSSLTGEGVDDVFEAATRVALLIDAHQSRSSCCVVL